MLVAIFHRLDDISTLASAANHALESADAMTILIIFARVRTSGATLIIFHVGSRTIAITYMHDDQIVSVVKSKHSVVSL